jgi:hypothetical protein
MRISSLSLTLFRFTEERHVSVMGTQNILLFNQSNLGLLCFGNT